NTAQMATVTSVSQLATTGARMLVNGRYPRSGIGIAADAFAAVQIAGFTLASLQQPKPVATYTTVSSTDALNQAAMSPSAAIGDPLYNSGVYQWYVLSKDFNNGRLVPIPVVVPAAVAGGVPGTVSS